jgi:hypothetical protein
MSPAMTQMNNQRPSLVGNQPGVAPGDGQTVRPKKMGVPTPAGGGPTAAGMPTKPPLAKRAAPPAGSKSLPGAKGPGDPKVANPIKKAQSGTTGRQIKINVAANQAPGASKTVSNSQGMASLKFGVGYTPGEMMAGPISLSDKVTDPQDEVAYNPVMRGHGKDCDCSACSKKMEARDFSQGQRKKLAKTGAAMPGGGFPISNTQDLANAKRAIGRAKNPAAARRHINERAKALGAAPIGQ